MQFKGIKEDLYTVTPNLSQSNWADDSTISQILLGQDEPLFTIDKKSQYSPFQKLYRDGNGWTLLWNKANHIFAKYYIQSVFSKNLMTWTGTDYSSLITDVPDPVEESTDKELVMEPVTESKEVGPTANKHGKTRRQITTDMKTGKRPAAITMDRSSQTTNAISTLTGQSHPYFQYGYTGSGGAYNQIGGVSNYAHAYGTLPQSQGLTQAKYANQPYQFQLQDNGETINIQQLNQILKTVERQAYSVMSSHLTQILAFHDPVKGIKNMLTDEINKLHETLQAERTTRNHEYFQKQSPRKIANLPRRKSLSDLTESQAFTSIDMLVTQQTENTTIESRIAAPAIKNSATASKKISGSYSANFRPPPERELQATQDINDGEKLPLIT
jgi:hypothetical protein